MTIAYSYLRFSTPEQAEGDSLRRQIALADDYAKRHGLTMDTELNLRDLGVSAFRGGNVEATSALGGFLKAIRDGLVPSGSFLLVESLDRISRQMARKAVRILEEIVEAGVTVVTLNDGKAYTEESLAGTDFLIAIIVLMRAHEESATKGKRVAAAWSAKRQDAAHGKLLTRLTPGWITAESGKPELIPERAKVVRQIFDMFLSGMGKESIAWTLNDGMVPTFGRADLWGRSYVAKILANPAVIGIFTPHTDDGRTRAPQTPLKGYYPAVIAAETFGRVQDLLGGTRATNRLGTGLQNILARLAICPKCGRAMTRVWKGKEGGEPKLVCTAAKVGKCDYVSVPLALVTAALVRAAAAPLPRAQNLDTEIRSAEAGMEATEEAIEELLLAIEQGHSPALLSRLKAREEGRDRAQATLNELQGRASQADTKLLKLRTARYRDAMLTQPLDVAKANAALRELVSRVVVDHESRVLRVHWRHDGETDIDYEPLKEMTK